MKLLRFLQDCEKITGEDGKEYGPFRGEDLAAIPDGNAAVFIETGSAAEVPVAQDVLETWEKSLPELTDEDVKKADENLHRAADAQERRERIKRESGAFLTWVPSTVFKGIKDKERTEYTLEIDYPAFADWLAKELKNVSFAGEVWINHGGIYVLDFGRVKALITELFNLNGVKTQINGYITELHHRMINRDPLKDYPFNGERSLIPVLNGVIRIGPAGGVALLPHDPKYRFNYQLPVSYDPSAPVEPVLAVLKAWVDEKDVPALVQFPAQALLQMQERTVYKRAYLFEGEKDSGKSTYRLLVLVLFGENQVGDLELGAIGARFAIAALEGKIINFYDDLSAFPLSYLGSFKKVTGGVWHDIERKGKDRRPGLITAVHGFTCNAPPRLENLSDDAFFSRWNYVVFPTTFPADPSWPTRTFTPAFLSGFLNLIIQSMIEIKKAGHLTYAMEPEDVREKWIYATEPLQRFKDENLVEAPGAWLPTEAVWERWIRWCRGEEEEAHTKAWLTQQFARLGVPARDKKVSKKSVRGYEGITWMGDATGRPEKWITETPDGESRISLGMPPIYKEGE